MSTVFGENLVDHAIGPLPNVLTPLYVIVNMLLEVGAHKI